MKTTGDDWRLLKGKHFHHCSYRLLLFNYCRSFWTDFKFLEASVGGENKAENKKKKSNKRKYRREKFIKMSLENSSYL